MTLYNRGMTSKGKGCTELHREAITKTGLPEQVVKDWIGNKRKALEERKYTYRRPIYMKGMSAYNYFVHDKKDQLKKFRDWGPAWKALPAAEKDIYKQKAKDTKMPCDPARRVKSLLKSITQQVSEIASLGCDLACIGVDNNDGKQIIIGNGRCAAFLSSKTELFQELYTCLSTDSKVNQRESLKDLRQRAQSHMNDLYSKAIGKQNAQFPYKKLRDGVISVEGIPLEIQPFRNVSHYGVENLNKILSMNAIQITKNSTPTVNASIISSSTTVQSSSGVIPSSSTSSELSTSIFLSPTAALSDTADHNCAPTCSSSTTTVQSSSAAIPNANTSSDLSTKTAPSSAVRSFLSTPAIQISSAATQCSNTSSESSTRTAPSSVLDTSLSTSEASALSVPATADGSIINHGNLKEDIDLSLLEVLGVPFNKNDSVHEVTLEERFLVTSKNISSPDVSHIGKSIRKGRKAKQCERPENPTVKKRKKNTADGDYFVEQLLDKRSTKRGREYLVKWLGYEEDKDKTWEPASHIPYHIISKYEDSIANNHST